MILTAAQNSSLTLLLVSAFWLGIIAWIGYENLIKPRLADTPYSLTIPGLEEMKKAILDKQFLEFQKAFYALSHPQQAFVLEHIAEDIRLMEVVETWISRFNSEIPYLIKTEQLIDLAWESRSSKRANEVDEQQWKGFFEYLNEAEETIEKAQNIKKNSIHVYTQKITLLLGLGHQLSDNPSQEVLEIVKQATAIDPSFKNIYRKATNLLATRWYGGFDEMIQFANTYKNDPLIGEYVLASVWCEITVECIFGDIKKAQLLTFTDEFKQKSDQFFQQNNKITEENYTLWNYYTFISGMLYPSQFKKRLKGMRNYVSAYPWMFVGLSSPKKLRASGENIFKKYRSR